MKFEFSAGGIVYKPGSIVPASKRLILVVQHGKYHHWSFPKGHIGDTIPGETKEEAALREVQEETGVTATILQEIGEQEYWYQFEGEKRKKSVFYFLMQYQSGDTTKRDHEMEQVEWLPEQEVLGRLTYPSDKEIWQKAQRLLQTGH
jgi:ADP-ribose pyrophosphatase YjhB (NUDIX family)